MGSSCTIRALGSTLQRFTSGVSSKFPNSSARTGLLSRSLSSSSSISPLPSLWTSTPVGSIPGERRTIRTVSPLSMGRRSSKIAGRKGVQDAKKMKLYSKIGKELVSALRKGGPNPGQEAYIEKVYEVYGYGGASMVVEVLTDKITRSVAAVREVVKNCGGKMADPGSVLFKFRRARVVNIKVSDADKDQLLSIALDAGAEDVIEPPAYEDDTEEDQSERYYKIVSDSENYSAILSKLRDEGIKFETDNGSELLPISPIEVDDEAVDLNKELMTNLLELDDVDAVYTDQK
ncbi:hypothetical protein ACLB2K_015000 [Fragaria x ananassa]